MGTVQVPLWLFLLLVLLAAGFILERVLLPGVRVVLRRKMRALAEQLSQRWAVRLQPFKLAKKRAVEHALTHDPEVLRCAEAYRQEHQLSWPEVEELLASYAREIVPTFNVYLYYRLGHAVARRLLRAVYLVRVGFSDKRALAEVDPEASVVFLMNHRSNVDYLLVAYLVSRHAAISYAVGEWAKVWPLDTLIRRLGGYFVRRNTADSLYRKVLERYVQMAAEAGIAQGVFPEGRLTRDGALQPPKLGLLHYLLKRFDPHGERDLVFVPVGINYDRVLEDRSHVFAAPSGQARFSWAAAFQVVGWGARMALRALLGRAQRFGYAAVHFGLPISAKELLAGEGDLRRLNGEAYREKVAQIGQRLWDRVAAAIPAVPFPILSQALLACGGRAEKAQVQKVHAQLTSFYRVRGLLLPDLEPGALFRHGVQLGLARGLLQQTADELAVAQGQEPMLRYYANSLAHHGAL